MIHSQKTYAFVGGLVLISPTATHGKDIILETMKKFDNVFFTADTIEVLRKYQRLLHSILYGTAKNNHTYEGKYFYKDKQYGSHQLAKIESQLEQEKENLTTTIYAAEKAALNLLLIAVIQDFERISKEFEPIIKETRHIMAGLIKESCAQRDRLNSLLLAWSNASYENGIDMLKKEVNSLIAFDQFCIDLLNFFGDMIRSCPKAQHVFETRVAKWTKVRQAVEAIKHSGKVFNESAFLKYIKQSVLDTLTIESIDTDTIGRLLHTFGQ